MQGVAEAIRSRVMATPGGLGDAALEFTCAGARFSIAADVVERAGRSFSYESLGTLGGLVESPLIQFPDLARRDTDKVLGTLGEGDGERLALVSFAFAAHDGPIEVRAVEDYTGDPQLADLACELGHVATCDGDVRVPDLAALDAAIGRQAEAGRVTDAALDALAQALSPRAGDSGPTVGAAAEARAAALERENAELRRRLADASLERRAPADRIDMLAPDPAQRYGGDAEETGLLPLARETDDAAAKKAALDHVRAELAEIGLLADETEVASSNSAWLAAGAGTERRDVDELLAPDEMRRFEACLRSAVSLGREVGTGSITGATCEVALPVRAGCYLSFDETAEPPVRTLKVFPSAAGTTAFDAQSFNSIACGYEHLIGRPDQGDPDLVDLKLIDGEVFGSAPGDGYEEPAAWKRAFDGARTAYNPQAGVLVSCMRTAEDESGEAGDRLVVASVGCAPEQVASAAEDGKTVVEALDEGLVGRAVMLCNLTRNAGVNGLEPDISRIGALVARDPDAWAVGGDEAVVTAARNAVQLKKAREARAEREEESTRASGGVFNLFSHR